jgi:hypothetical protein
MSATDIIRELPRLTEAERRAVRDRLLEIANSDEDISLCNRVATEAAVMLDRMEDEDAGHQSR